MENINIYEDVSNVNLGNEIQKLEDQNRQLLNHIHKLEGDIEKLCTELTNMKQVQKNLSRNISELFKTAKLEIQRKDNMIAELRTELDNLMLGKRSNFRTLKRQLHTETTNNHSKRHKSNTSDNEIADNRKANGNSTRSSSKELRDNVKENNEKDVRIQHKDDHDFKQSSHHNSPSRKSMRNDDKYNNKGRNNERYRRSKSNDRYGRSKSRNRFMRSKSYNRYRRSKSIGRSNRDYNNIHRNIEDNKSRSGSTDSKRSNRTNEKRSRSKSNYRYSHKQKYFNNTLVQELEDDDLKVIDDDLEEGEIASETAKSLLIENNRNQNRVRNGRCTPSNELNVKSITIQEYRNRQKPSTSDNNEVEDYIKLETEQNLVIQNKMKNDNNSEKDVVDIEKAPLENNNKNCILDDAKELTNSILLNDLSCELSKSCNDNDNVLNNSSSLNNSKNNSLNNSNSNSLSNSGINNSLKVRRRRCVVIGIKNKI